MNIYIRPDEKFQFTHPGKGATVPYVNYYYGVKQFQFTHPGKGATGFTENPNATPYVSIHAPWEGCDVSFQKHSVLLPLFQFTHPGKGATTAGLVAQQVVTVSIHAPWEGCDLRQGSRRPPHYRVSIHAPWEGCDQALDLLLLLPVVVVSIHAPWEGCDRARRRHSPRSSRFNSRTLGRVRRNRGEIFAKTVEFQFTHPGKGATL